MTRWIPCKIENSGFSGERRFEVDLPDGGRAVGTAPVQYLRTADRRGIEDGNPTYGETIKGFVQCRVIREVNSNDVLVEFPSSDVFHVPAEALVDA
jgi:hypothetical protein